MDTVSEVETWIKQMNSYLKERNDFVKLEKNYSVDLVKKDIFVDRGKKC